MFDVPSTIGALEIAALISIFLFGMATVQTFTYYKSFPEDACPLKAFVGVIWTMELVHAIALTQYIYYYSVTGYGDPKTIIELPTGGYIVVIVTGLVTSSIQAFFTYRIRMLRSARCPIPYIAWLLCLLRCVSNLALGGVIRDSPDLMASNERWRWLFITTLAISPANDILITASLCYYLWPHRNTPLERTKAMVDRLILWAVQTGMVTSFGTLAQIILFLVLDDYIWVAVFLITTRLYSNTLMASLNARTTLRSLNGESSIVTDVNFASQSTSPPETNATMINTQDQCDRDIELGKSLKMGSGSTEEQGCPWREPLRVEITRSTVSSIK